MKNFKILLCTALLSLLLINSAVPALAYTDDDDTMYTMYVNDQRVGLSGSGKGIVSLRQYRRGVKRGYQEESSSIPRFASQKPKCSQHHQ